MKNADALARRVVVGVAFDGGDDVSFNGGDDAGVATATAMVDEEDGAGFDEERDLETRW